MRGAAGVQPHHAPAVRSACLPPGRRESTGRDGACNAGRRGRCPACQQATGWSDGAARWLSPPGVPVSPRHKGVALVEWPRLQLALLKAAAAARDLSGLVLPRAPPCCPCYPFATATACYSALPAPPGLSRRWSGPLCPGRKHSRSSSHGLAGKAVLLPGILLPCMDRTFSGKV